MAKHTRLFDRDDPLSRVTQEPKSFGQWTRRPLPQPKPSIPDPQDAPAKNRGFFNR